MIKSILLWLISIYFKPAELAEPQLKENTVKLSLVSIITSQLADGLAANRVLATLTDDAGVAQPGAAITFTADYGATGTTSTDLTDLNGQITVSLVSSIAGSSTLTAQAVDGTTACIQVYFVAVTSPIIDPDLKKSSLPAQLSPLEAMKDEFSQVVAFIEHGIEVLGKDAEADLVALKNKFIL